MPNRLIDETSPYLLQHAHNPVDWYPWGDEALARARAEDKPILLSIGYSACHWCHVMERESFESPSIAAQMNADFVSVKVDREERPDLDAIYMQAVQAMTGSGGWPMTVFLAPDGTPFYGGTYFPPADRGGMPGFPRVLSALANAWRTRRDEVLQNGAQLRAQLQQTIARPSAAELDAALLDSSARAIVAQHDPAEGGFGHAPKFPQPMAIEFLLRHWKRTNDEPELHAAVHTLERMARGGIYDHLGGGFARYSTDQEWLVPHFEKMLYDNAQLARAYLMAYQATDNAFFKEVAEETIDYVLRDMTDPSGGFYSTEDADSEGEEGKFYLWTPSEVEQLLGASDARLFCAFFDVRSPGNFEHRASILRMRRTPLEVAGELNVTEVELLAALERGRSVLFEARSKRVRPARDEKVLAGWNGMMLRAVAEAANVLSRGDYLDAAKRNAEFLITEMRAPDGTLFRSWKARRGRRLKAYLEDYANVADGLLALYEATFEPRWLQVSIELADNVMTKFEDRANGGFFDTSDEHEVLIARPKDVFDNATPSGNAVAADVLLRLALLTDRQEFRDAAEGVLRLLKDAVTRYPLGFARALNALDFLLDQPKEVAIVGPAGARETEALRQATFELFIPNKVVAGAGAPIPLLEEREQRDGRALAYVCEHYVCQAPTADPDQLRRLLSD